MRNAEAILVSIIVPVFNVRNYLDHCLSSVRAQTHLEIEIIVVEDCSTDDSLQIIDQHRFEDDRIRLIQHKRNCGLSAARNTGIQAAKGEYIVFVDSDDFIDPQLVERCLSAAMRTAACVVIYKHVTFPDGGSLAIASGDRTGMLYEFGFRDPHYFDRPYFAWLKFSRTDFLKKKKIKFPMGFTYEDHPFHWKLGLEARKIVELQETLYFYRLRPGGITSSGGRNLIDRIHMYKMIALELRGIGENSAIIRTFNSKCVSAFFFTYFNLHNKFLDEATLEIKKFVSDESISVGVSGENGLREKIFFNFVLSKSRLKRIALHVFYWTRLFLKRAKLL